MSRRARTRIALLPLMLRRLRFDLLVLAVVLLSAVPLIGWAYAPQRQTVLRADSLSVMLPGEGLHAIEPLVDRDGAFRWTTGSAVLEPPNPGGLLYLRLSLASGFADATAVTVQAGNTRYAFEVGPGLRKYHLVLPPLDGERAAFAIDSATQTINERDLGIMFTELRISGGGTLPLFVGGVVVLATFGVYLLVRAAGAGPFTSGAIVLTLQILVTLWQAAGAWRYGLLTPLLGLGGVAALAAALFTWRWPAPAEAAAPSVVAFTARDRGALAGVLLLALLCCLPWLGAPDPVGDLELSARRMGFMVANGFAGAFSGGGDYMPFRLYILRGLARVGSWFGAEFFEPLPAVTRILIKLPSLLALLVSVGLLFRWARAYGTTGWAALIAGLYAVAPPVWMNVAWWGQVDVLLSLPMLAAVILFERSGGRWSWICWAAALLIKPQAIILAPLLYGATLRRYGARGLAIGGGLLLALLVLAAAPFVLAGEGPGLYQAVAGSVGRFPTVTNRAYNLWYLVAGTRIVSDLTMFGPLSYRSIGIMLLGGVALPVLLVLLWRDDRLTRALAAAALALGFFVLPTQIHERYSFFALAFLLLVAAMRPYALAAFGLLCVGALINLFGAIDGFSLAAHEWIEASLLPALTAWTALAILVWLLAALFRPDLFLPATHRLKQPLEATREQANDADARP
jgi:Gpi18-like mannosyltransferase